jgi:hypothetical protein
VIAGNKGDGIRIYPEFVVVNNAHIGVGTRVTANTTVSVRAPNMGNGITSMASATSLRIGLTMPSNRVVISGNGGHGVFAQGRYLQLGLAHVGVNPQGNSILANFGDGIHVADSGDDPKIGSKRFGSVDAIDSQTIVSGNRGAGIYSAAIQSFVYSAYVGLDATGLKPLPNQGDAGIVLGESATDSRLGLYLDVEQRLVLAGNRGALLSFPTMDYAVLGLAPLDCGWCAALVFDLGLGVFCGSNLHRPPLLWDSRCGEVEAWPYLLGLHLGRLRVPVL